jgi:HNH endonuclease
MPAEDHTESPNLFTTKRYCRFCNGPNFRIGTDFCSTKCARRFTAGTLVGEKQCEQCGGMFQFATTPKLAAKIRFCSSRCYGMSIRIPIEQRFWNQVDKNGPIPAHVPHLGKCWIWTGRRGKGGYGVIHKTASDSSILAHRFSYDLANADAPAGGLLVCHKCDVRLCIRPDHLFVGKHFDNTLDAAKKGRLATKLTMIQVEEIIASGSSGKTAAEIAERFGISEGYAYAIVSGRYVRIRPELEIA